MSVAEILVADVREESLFALVDDVVAGRYADTEIRLEEWLDGGAAGARL